MARLWSCGFELQSVTAGVEFDTVSGSPAISRAIKRSGEAALRCNAAAADCYIEHTTSGGNFFMSRAYIYIATAPDKSVRVLYLWEWPATPMMWLELTTASKIQLWGPSGAGYAQLGSDSAALSLNTWYRIETYWNSVGTTWAFRGRLDGSTFATGSYAAGTGYPFVTRMRIGIEERTTHDATADIYFDDVAINDSSGALQTGYPGIGSILHLNPDSAGDNNPTAGTWDSVDEVPPNDADYIELDETATIGDFNLESYANAGGNAADTITLVQVGARVRGELAGPTQQTRIKSQTGGTVATGVTKNVETATWVLQTSDLIRIYYLTSYTDPQAGGVWTPALLNTAQIGVTPPDATPDLWVSNLWALVEYVPGAVTSHIKKAAGVYREAIKEASGETLAHIKKLAGESNV